MPRAGLSKARVVQEAALLVDELGTESLSLATLASRLGVRPPSLYKHVDGLPALQRAIALQAKQDLADAVGQAAIGLSGGDAIAAIAHAYRRWARAHPGQYPATAVAPDLADEEDVAVSASLLDVVATSLAPYSLTADDATDAIRMLRATLHGFVSLEVSGGFELPRGRNESYAWMVHSLVTALEARANQPV